MSLRIDISNIIDLQPSLTVNECIISCVNHHDIIIDPICFSLCMKEQVHGDYKVKADQQDKVMCHSKHHEVSIGFSHSHFVLPIPLQLAPSFSTPVCCVSYYLHFEFVTTSESGVKQEIPKVINTINNSQ